MVGFDGESLAAFHVPTGVTVSAKLSPPSTSPARTCLGITSVYLQGIDNAESIETVHAREAPMVALKR